MLRDLIAYTVLANSFLSGQMDTAGFTFSVSAIAHIFTVLYALITVSRLFVRSPVAADAPAGSRPSMPLGQLLPYWCWRWGFPWPPFP